jgi:2-octaprenyl-6-methoxyphenol hydroxylase|tara:strand:- start:2792 stop:3865 length:1074 start_codon:yes stop_codon:yes gene_type:complete
MKVSILGNSLTSLTLAKLLVNQGIKVDIFGDKKNNKNNKIQTVGISKSNIDFFNENILDIKKFLWNINNIEIFSENLKNQKLLNFENNKKTLFSMIKNSDLYNFLFFSLNKNKLVKFKKKISYNNLIQKNYDVIFNCDYNNLISKKFFFRKIDKDYKGFAHISIINHKRLFNNNVASQIFTKKGPLAFLPISPTETSVVYSARGSVDINIEEIIKKFNSKYKINKISKSTSFELKSSCLRSYYHKNIIAFGDMLHKLHPLAGQGFNMTIRDIKKIYELIKFRKEHGLDLNISLCSEFEKSTRDKNFLFLNGIDLIYEFFNYENKININNFSKSLKFFGKNKIINNFFTKFADNGLAT